MQSSAYLRDAAVAAGHALGVFEALARGPASLGELATVLGVPGGQRLRALLDVLAALGAIACDRAAPGGPRFAAGAEAPPRPAVAAAGWGLLAEVIRSDRPLLAGRGGLDRDLPARLPA
ncbi:MAG TPA: hypothetical protein VFT22_39555, partial [Kofleriaceae bacterium]|nr:hypothetical protein [Kofleriaceae bacterium]